jgi:hypothetical protein
MGSKKSNISGLRPFKKGQSGNPQGARLHNPEIKKIKALTEAELIEVATFVLKSSVGQIKMKMKDPKTPVLQGMVLGLALKTMVKGDAQAFNALMDRLLGKVKENLNLSGHVGGVSKVILTMPANGSEAEPGEENG